MAQAHCTEAARPFIAEVMTVSDSEDWSTSTPTTAPSLALAAAATEANMEPPQAKTTSVPFSYQPLTMVCSSGEAEKVPPYSQE